MEISNENPAKINPYVNQLQQQNKAADGSEKNHSEAAKGDRVALSDTALEMQKARQALKEIPDVRDDKVAALKESIDNGTYEINADKIADRMLKESLFNDL